MVGKRTPAAHVRQRLLGRARLLAALRSRSAADPESLSLLPFLLHLDFFSILDIRDVEGKYGSKYHKTENIKGRKNSRLKQNEKKKTGKEDIVQLKLDTRGEAGSESEKGVRLTRSFFILKAPLSVVKRTPTLQNHLSPSPCDTQAAPSLRRRRVPSRQQCCPWPGPFSPHLPTFIPADIISPLSFVFLLHSSCQSLLASLLFPHFLVCSALV